MTRLESVGLAYEGTRLKGVGMEMGSFVWVPRWEPLVMRVMTEIGQEQPIY